MSHPTTQLWTIWSIAKGKYIEISPVGNGTIPARYFTVFPNEVTKNPVYEINTSRRQRRQKG